MKAIVVDSFLTDGSDVLKREHRWIQIFALVVAVALHLLAILVLPAELVSTGADRSAVQPSTVYEIRLVEPEEQRFVEASPEAPENVPDRTDQYSYRDQQAADENPLSDETNQPAVEGEDGSSKILQGALEQVPPVEPGVYTPSAQAGEGPEEAGGKLGQPSEAVALPVQPLPAPKFIQQDPVTEEGPGSRSKLVGEAPEVAEEVIPDAPINIYRPPTNVAVPEVNGDGAGGAIEAKQAPRVRPRLAPELIHGPLIRSQSSANRRGSLAIDATFSEFGEYEQQFYAAIQAGWNQEIEYFQPIDTAARVQVSFTIHADGRVENVEVVHTTASGIATEICLSAITKRSPFRPWTREMVQVFGQERTLRVQFRYL